MTPDEIERLYLSALRTGFPYRDSERIRHGLSPATRRRVCGFNPDLDAYLSLIAGFASSATTIAGRSTEQLRKYLPFLDKGFYETYPQYAVLRASITSNETPSLFAHLEAGEILRVEVARLIRSSFPGIDDHEA
jgi:hypothetical protein